MYFQQTRQVKWDEEYVLSRIGRELKDWNNFT